MSITKKDVNKYEKASGDLITAFGALCDVGFEMADSIEYLDSNDMETISHFLEKLTIRVNKTKSNIERIIFNAAEPR